MAKPLRGAREIDDGFVISGATHRHQTARAACVTIANQSPIPRLALRWTLLIPEIASEKDEPRNHTLRYFNSNANGHFYVSAIPLTLIR